MILAKDRIATGRRSACEGLAPYWFDVEATAYVGPSGRTAARVELQYDLLFTQRLILQPNMEFSLYGKSDPERGIGSGFSTLDLGLRLRYEIRRQFAPYLGVVFTSKVRRDRRPCARGQ